MRVRQMVDNSVALRALARHDTQIGASMRRLTSGRLGVPDDASGNVRSWRLATDASTMRLAATAASYHSGALQVADSALAAVHGELVELRVALIGGSNLATAAADRLEAVRLLLDRATHHTTQLFAGQAGTAREYQPEIVAVEAADATEGSYAAAPTILDGAGLAELAAGVSIELEVDGVATTITVGPTGGYADAGEFAAALIDAADDEGVTVTWADDAFTFTSQTTGAGSSVVFVSGPAVLALEGGLSTPGSDAVEAVEGRAEVLARGNLALQFRTMTDRIAPAPPVDPDAEVDPDAAYVVPAHEMAVTIARIDLGVLGLEGFDPHAADAMDRVDAALRAVSTQQGAIGAAMSSLERFGATASAQSMLLDQSADLITGTDVAAEFSYLSAARVRRDGAVRVLSSSNGAALSTMGSLLGAMLDVRV